MTAIRQLDQPFARRFPGAALCARVVHDQGAHVNEGQLSAACGDDVGLEPAASQWLNAGAARVDGGCARIHRGSFGNWIWALYARCQGLSAHHKSAARAAVLAPLAIALACAAQAHTTVLYSRADSTKALHAFRFARVFGPVRIDLAMQPGTRWRPEMAAAICSAHRVLVLWSQHAAASAELAQELTLARDCAAPLVPVLLDDTPLPAGLAELQAVDWRDGAARPIPRPDEPPFRAASRPH